MCEVLEQSAPDIRSVGLSLGQWWKSDIDGSWHPPRLSGVDQTNVFVASEEFPDPAELGLS